MEQLLDITVCLGDSAPLIGFRLRSYMQVFFGRFTMLRLLTKVFRIEKHFSTQKYSLFCSMFKAFCTFGLRRAECISTPDICAPLAFVHLIGYNLIGLVCASAANQRHSGSRKRQCYLSNAVPHRCWGYVVLADHCAGPVALCERAGNRATMRLDRADITRVRIRPSASLIVH